MFKRLIASLVCFTFSFGNFQQSYAQDFSVNQLPVPGTMIGESTPFAPLALKGLVVNPQKPLEFQFIVDTGKGPQDTASVKDEAKQLVKYFLAGLTIPERDLWVNLSPYEKNRMVPEVLGQTDLGRDLLAQDYILKQLTASLIYPEKDLGKEFWSRVYAKAEAQFGTTNVPVNTFNKVWILPDQAQVFENNNAAYVTKATLKVMLDEDYTALQKHLPIHNSTDSIGSQVVRQIVLPEITKEVNTGKNFAPLRQIYQALILAKWYKETIQNSLLDALYTNKNKVAGVNLNDPNVKEQIYNRYLQAYKKGAFNYIKEDPTPNGQVVPRKYFSGGTQMIFSLNENGTQQQVESQKPDGAMIVLVVTLAIAAGGLLWLAQRSIKKSLSTIELVNVLRTANMEYISSYLKRKYTDKHGRFGVLGAYVALQTVITVNIDRVIRFSEKYNRTFGLQDIDPMLVAGIILGIAYVANKRLLKDARKVIEDLANKEDTKEFDVVQKAKEEALHLLDLKKKRTVPDHAMQTQDSELARLIGVMGRFRKGDVENEALMEKALQSISIIRSQGTLSYEQRERLLGSARIGLLNLNEEQYLRMANELLDLNIDLHLTSLIRHSQSAVKYGEMAVGDAAMIRDLAKTALGRYMLQEFENGSGSLEKGQEEGSYTLNGLTINPDNGSWEIKYYMHNPRHEGRAVTYVLKWDGKNFLEINYQEPWTTWGISEKFQLKKDPFINILSGKVGKRNISNIVFSTEAIDALKTMPFDLLNSKTMVMMEVQIVPITKVYLDIEPNKLSVAEKTTFTEFFEENREKYAALNHFGTKVSELKAGLNILGIETIGDYIRRTPSPLSVLDKIGRKTIDRFDDDFAHYLSVHVPYSRQMTLAVFLFLATRHKALTKVTSDVLRNKLRELESFGIVTIDDLYTKPDVKRFFTKGEWKRLNDTIDGYHLDPAMANDVGGIDLNQIAIKRTGKIFKVQFDRAQLIQLEQGGFEGFTPVITSMTHISSPFQLLGINASKQV